MPHEETLFEGIHMIEQGTYLHFGEDGKVEKKHYFHYKFTDIKLGSDEQIISKVGKTLENSIKKKLLAKVPVAAFLSGGIDSSLICKIASDHFNQDLNTFTVWYDSNNDPDYLCARELAKKEGFIQHNTLIQPEDYSIDKLDEVIYHVEELLVDKVYLSVFENYRHAKEAGFTVVLNGQGADECWLGYINNWNIYEYSKTSEESLVEELIDKYHMINNLFNGKLQDRLVNATKDSLKEYLNENMMKYSDETIINRMQIMSLRTILHDLLMQEDKLAMAHSVESRVPFVDNKEMVSLSLSVGDKLKIKDGHEKYVLRSVGNGILPESIIKRQKMPFQEPPGTYNVYLDNILKNYWNNIKESNIINNLFKPDCIIKYSEFTEAEKWWIINLWRIENVFKMVV